jgi:hypothetical protein
MDLGLTISNQVTDIRMPVLLNSFIAMAMTIIPYPD